MIKKSVIALLFLAGCEKPPELPHWVVVCKEGHYGDRPMEFCGRNGCSMEDVTMFICTKTARQCQASEDFEGVVVCEGELP